MFRIRVERWRTWTRDGNLEMPQCARNGLVDRRCSRSERPTAERLLYVRRIVDQWIARIAIPKPARRKLVAESVADIRQQSSDQTSRERNTTSGGYLH